MRSAQEEGEDKTKKEEEKEGTQTTTTAPVLPPTAPPTAPPLANDYHWLQDKLTNPFSRIKKTNTPTSTDPPEKAAMEWKTSVKNRESAIAWHLKWTPWFSPQMIEGIVDHGYKMGLPHQKL